MQQHDDDDDEHDRATTARLAKLRTLPVDTSRLDAAIRQRIDQVPRERTRWPRIVRRAAAAAVLVGLLVGAAVLLVVTRPALASPAQMAQVHADLVSGRTPVMQVDSLEAAARALSRQCPQPPGLPGLPQQHVMACCMKSVKNKQMACVLLKSEGAPVTMCVARAEDMRLPSSPTRMRDGVTYHVQSVDRLNMVMTERQDRWICLIGELPAERLMDLAEQLQF
jgi:hypothetical protein